MPRRTIVIGRQPSAFQFQDDFGPLNNGLAYAAGQWLASGRDRAQIEMQREQQDKEQATHDAERQQDVDFRTQDMELRKLALGQQDQQRQDALEERSQQHQAMMEHNANVLRETKVKNAADAAAKFNGQMGEVGKYIFDWIRGGNPAGAPKDGQHAAADLGRHKAYYQEAIDEFGDPNFDLELRDELDRGGKPTGRKYKVERPLTPQERASRIDRINARVLEKEGHPFKPVEGFHADSGPIGQSAEDPDGVASLSNMALGGAANTPPTDEAGAGAVVNTPLDPVKFREAETRVNQTLLLPGLTPAQRKALVETLRKAKANDPEAIQWLMDWHDQQPDTAARAEQDKADAQAMNDGVIYGLR